MRIDFHVHLTPPEIRDNPERYAEREPHFAALCRSPANKFAGGEEVVAMLDRSGFDRAVVFGFAFRDPGLCRLANDYVVEQMSAFPDRLIGFAAVSPAEPGLEAEIDRCRASGLRGIGELYPTGQGFDLDSRPAADLAGLCVERNLPLMIHVNEPVGHDYPGKTDTGLAEVQRFVMANPEAKIVLAHLGGGLPFFESMPELRRAFRNVRYDTAAVPFLYDPSVYRALPALGLADKILFGSDFPLLSPSRYMPALNSVLGLDLDRILGENARSLLGIG